MTDAGMAMRNIFRYKKRSMITAAAIAFGVMFTIMIDGLLAGTETESARNIRNYETGEAKIYPSGYFDELKFLPFNYFLEQSDRDIIEQSLAGYTLTPRANLSAELYFSGDSFKVAGSVSTTLTAIDPVRDTTVFDSGKMVSEGRWLRPGDTGVVIGSWLATDIGATPGAFITIECKGRGGFYQTFDAEIVGLVTTDNPIVNKNAVFMDLSYADEILALNGGITEYTLRLPPVSALKRKIADVQRKLPSYAKDVHSWEEIAKDEILLTKSKSSGSKIYLFFMFVIAAVGISNTMLMAVMERKNEIGMLRALGYSSFKIRRLFLFEGFGIGLIGSAMGLAAGSLLNLYFVIKGLDFSFMFRDMDIGYRITGIMRSAWNLKGIISTVIGALVISTLVAWFPPGRILKREVAEILRK